MPTTDPLGTRLPVVSDTPDVPGDLSRYNEDIRPAFVPAFDTEAERNTAFAAVGFRLCTIGNVLYLRRGNAWVTVLAGTDIDTGWLAPTMGAGWSSLGADPARYRVTAGAVQFRGVAYQSGGVPGTSSMLVVPSNAMPGNASGWTDLTYAVPCVATSLNLPTSGATPHAKGYINLRPSGSMVCVLPDGVVAGVTKVSLYIPPWFL